MQMKAQCLCPSLAGNLKLCVPPLLTGLQLKDMQMGGTLSVKWGLIPLFLPASRAAFSKPVLAGGQLRGANGERWATLCWLPGNRRQLSEASGG